MLDAENQLSKAQSKVSTWTKPRNTTALISIANGNLDKASKIIQDAEKVKRQCNEYCSTKNTICILLV